MLSIIVPVYNVEQYLSRCINSILNQTYSDFELILVNDGSTDGSKSICDAFAKEDARIRVLNKENGGLMSAWTEGTKIAQGDYVGYIDSDDYISEDYFFNLMKPIHEHGCDISVCGFTRVSRGHGDIQVLAANGDLQGLYLGEELEQLKQNFYTKLNVQNSRCIKIFKKKLVLDNLSFLDETITLGEDKTITVPCFLDSHSIYINNLSFGYYYRINENSMSHLFNPKLVDNYERLYKNITTSFRSKGYMNEQVEQNMADEIVSVAAIIAFSDNKLREKKAYLKQLCSLDSWQNIKKFELNNPERTRVLLYRMLKMNAHLGICFMASIRKKVRGK